MFARLDGKVLVAGQISPADVGAAADEGVSTIVNNRPDGEEPGQPDSVMIAEAARRAGLDYYHIPVAGGLSPDQVAETLAAIESAKGQVLLFCRSGTRSTYLWALARSESGVDGEALIASAAAAGFDLEPLRAHLSRSQG